MNIRQIFKENISYSLNFNESEKLLLKEFAEWFPKKMIDCHAHCNLIEHVGLIPQKSITSMISTFPFYSIRFSKVMNKLLYPNSEVITLRFPNVFPGVKLREANSYLLKKSPKSDGVALFGSADDPEYVEEMLNVSRPKALKMYWFYTEKSAETINECFPEKILKVCEELDIPIILHLPKIITKSKNDLLAVSERHPKLRICVPHLGSTKFLVENLEETYKEIAKRTNIYFDTSLNPSFEVIEMAFKHFGSSRIMFGSDQPLNLIRSIPYINPNKGQRIVTEYKYHWVDEDEHKAYKHLAKNLIHCHWLALNPLKKVIDCYEDSNHVKNQVFYSNAKTFYKL